MADKKFDLDKYETVKERKKRFYKDHPDGSIIVEAITITEEMAIMKAIIYKNKEDQKNNLPTATGHAQEIREMGGFANKFSWCENAEESSVGRALDQAGYAGNDKCSREEMEKVQRGEESKTKVFEKPQAKPGPKPVPGGVPPCGTCGCPMMLSKFPDRATGEINYYCGKCKTTAPRSA